MANLKTYKIFMQESKELSFDKYVITSYDAADTADKQFILNHKKQLFDFLDKGYIHAGLDNFIGCDNENALGRNAIYVRIATNQNDDIIAVSVYTGRNKGKKCVGITATTDLQERELGKKALCDIIKLDVNNWHNWFWTEACGPIEHLYIKNNAFIMPKEFAKKILFHRNDIDYNTNDDYHFRVISKKNGRPVEKCILGFNDEQTFNEVKEHYEKEIIDFLNKLEKKKYESKEYNINTDIDVAYATIFFFVEEWEKYDAMYYSQELINRLSKSIKYLESEVKKEDYSGDKDLKNCIWNGKQTLNRLKPVILHRLVL